MPDDVDPELLVEAILLHVEDMNTATAAAGNAWLLSEFKRVLGAVMSGAVFVTSLTMEGSSSQQAENVNAKELLAILTQCRKRLPDADGNITDPGAPAMLIPRLADFPLS